MTTATTVRERPILFKGETVRAILEGRKTQTRRIITSSRVLGCLNKIGSWGGPMDEDEFIRAMCPYGEPGGRLWVRESAYIAPPNFGDEWNCIDNEGRRRLVGYVASMDSDAIRCAEEFGIKRSPSIHMPRWASRLVLEIERAREERLQSISNADALAEGCKIIARDGKPPCYVFEGSGYNKAGLCHTEPSTAFLVKWDEINGKRGHSDSNPWVWVITFKRVSP